MACGQIRFYVIVLLAVVSTAHGQIQPFEGKSLDLTLPAGFKLLEVDEGPHDEHSEDVQIALLEHENGCRLNLYFTSAVPVSESEIEQFGAFMIATWGKHMKNFKLLDHKIVEVEKRKWIFITFNRLEDDSSRIGIMLFRSLNGSPLRFTLLGNSKQQEFLTNSANQIIEKNSE